MRALFAAIAAFGLLALSVSGCVGQNELQSGEKYFAEISTNGSNGTLLAGEFVEFCARTDAPNATLVLPPGFIVAADGKLQAGSNITIASGEARFKALAPPTARGFNFTITNGEYSKTIEIATANGNSPAVSGENIFKMVQEVTSNPVYWLRVTGSPTLEAYKLNMASILQGYGLDVQFIPFQSGDGRILLNVVAYHWGANDKEWIVIGGHADTAFEITIQGAYDNTAGISTVVELARVFSQYAFDKTIVFGLWGGEEEGLFGSQFFTSSIPSDVKVSAYLNFDMVGINWPGPATLHEFMAGGPSKTQIEFGKLVTHKICGYPEDNKSFKICKDTLGRSDHENFAALKIPSFAFIGAIDAEYPNYHTPNDTFENMVSFMGSEEMLARGFAVPAWIGFYETVLLQNGYPLTAV